MRSFLTTAPFCLWLLFCAFRSGLLWNEPERLHAFWSACALGAFLGVVLWVLGSLLWEGFRFLWTRRISAAERAWQQERTHVVTFLRQQAEAHRQQAIHADEDLRHGLEMGEVALDSAAAAIENAYHLREVR